MGSGNNTGFKPISERERWLTEQIVQIAIAIHRKLGAGLPEAVYKKCFWYELQQRGIPFSKQVSAKIIYANLVMDESLQVDILIDDLIIVELKAQEYYLAVWEAQLLNYLKLTGKRLGYILHFNVPLMKNGIKRMIYQ